MTEKIIVTMWMKKNTVKAAFSDNGKIYTKECSTLQEAKSSFDTIKKMLEERGHMINLQDLEK